MKKQRILYCSENYSPHDHRFLTALGMSGHEIYWLRLEEGGRVQEIRPLPDAVIPVAWRKNQKPVEWPDYKDLAQQFYSAVELVKPDLIHAGPVQRVAYLPVLIDFHPLMVMSWGFDLLEDVRRDETWEENTRFVLKHCDWFTSDCRTTQEIAINFGMPESRTTVFPWGVDQKIFNPDGRGSLRRQFGYTEDLLIAHTRSWEPRYGVDIALEGFFLALQEVPNLQLLLFGSGSQENQIRSFISEKGISDRVHFCGYKENEALARYYQAADVYLSASHIDGSSVALMEAMACGCPALVSDIPANMEWISDGVQGWVFRDGNAKHLAEKIVRIAGQSKERQRCGKNAQSKAKIEANWQKNFAKLMESYQLMVNFSRRSGK